MKISEKLTTLLKDKIMIKRIWMTILGVTICGISVGFFGYANFGVDPYQVLVHGLFYSFIEPLITVFNESVAQPMLYGKRVKSESK